MSSSGEIYGMHLLPDRFNADILLPNGLFMTIPCKREDTLENVKRQLWKAIKSTTAKYFNIGDQSTFIFSAITNDAKLEEFYEESRRLCDLRLFDLTLKLVEPQGNTEEKRLNSMIDLSVGKKVNELILELPRDIREEVTEFRKCISRDQQEDSILQQIDQGLLFSSYSSFVDTPFKIRVISATYVNVKNVDAMFVRVAVFHGTECLDVHDTNHVEPTNPKWDQWLDFNFHCTELPRSAKICLSICVVSKKKAKEICSLGSVNVNLFDYRGYMRSGRTQLNLWPPIKDSDEILFPLGSLGSNPNNESACLLLELPSFDRHVVFAPVRDIYTYAAHAIKQEPQTVGCENVQIPSHPAMSNSTNSISNCHTHYSSIRLDFRDRTLSNSCADTRAFIERRLSSSSSNQNRRDSISTTYNDNLTSTSNRSRRPTTNSERFSASSSRTSSTASMLTRLDSNAASKLTTITSASSIAGANGNICSSNYGQNQSSNSNINNHTLTNNSPINYSNTLLVQPTPTTPSSNHSPIPPTTNSTSSFAQTVPTNVGFNNPHYSSCTTPLSDNEPINSPDLTSTSTSSCFSGITEEQNINLVNELIGTPPFTPLTKQQKSLLWNMRFYCKRIPESLPKLLDAIDWKSRNQVSQLYVLLDEWGQISLETALRLLHPKYEDSYVRQHAVKWLDFCIDEEMLSCYLLQFVQVLKIEPYIESELAKFLINRSSLNPSIGNLFFWYLKSECDEINDYYNTIKFRYIMERFLKGLDESQLSTLTRQVQGLDKLMNLAEAMKDKTKEDRIKFMQAQMQRVDFCEMLQNIPDPTNNNRFLGELLFEECRIMDSAKKPLWLVWTLPIFTDERSQIYTFNPKSEQDILENSNSRSQKRSHSYSSSKEYTNKETKSIFSKGIKEEDSISTSSQKTYDTVIASNTETTADGSTMETLDNSTTSSRFSSRTMTSSSDSAKGSSTMSNSGSKTELMSSSSGCASVNGVPVATSAIIFKIGDDLRQDMLTLQIIRIVDSIWRQEGLDMCMLAYTCLATGKNVGIIEVVNRAETITSIQKSGGRMATIQIDNTQLHRWIKDKNQDNYDEAIRRFTRSCAGYSVLTFVLGIADRNPDNIMVSEDGRIFHIDFGHFLGHFKKKFGINRERVPFVLTDDFLYVIARGSDVRKSTSSFDMFRELCGDAYVSLRKHSNLLITLFTMMLRTGIPELRTLDDISYLKTSLQVGVSDEKAKEFFQAQFFEAYCGAWATKVDWFFHNIKRL